MSAQILDWIEDLSSWLRIEARLCRVFDEAIGVSKSWDKLDRPESTGTISVVDVVAVIRLCF